MVRAPIIGGVLLGVLAAASLLWPGGAGPGGLLDPERLSYVLPAAWLCWCLLAAGRPGAHEAALLAAPALLAGISFAPNGPAAMPGTLLVLAAGAAWWSAVAARPSWREHALPVGAVLLLAPPLLRALWAGAGLGEGPLPAWISPVGVVAPAWWSAIPLAEGAALMRWRAVPAPGVVAATLVFVALSGATAAAQEVQVTAVLGPHHRPGRFVPVAVDVRAGATPLNGQVRLEVDGGPTVTIPVALPANGRLRRVVPLTAQGASPRVTARVSWTAPGADPVAVLRLTRPAPSTALVLAVAADESEQRTFNQLRLQRHGHALIACSPESLPERAEYYESIDSCLLGALTSARLSDGAVAAITQWAQAGGRLLLTDPDLLRRVPALDRALFPPRGTEESLPPAIDGLPGHFAQALRRRGLGPRDVVYDAGGRPHHIRFRAGQGEGALMLQPLLDPDGRTVMARLTAEFTVAIAADRPVPTLSAATLAAFPPAAPGGWPRFALGLWLLAVPLLGLAWNRRQRLATGALAGATLVAGWLGVAATAPVAQVVTIATLGARQRTEQVVHVAAAREAHVSIALADAALPRPLARRAGELRNALGTVRWSDAPRWTEWPIARGGSRVATLAPATRPARRLLGVRVGRRILLSNESGVPITACLLAWRGRLLNLGPLDAGEVRSVEFADQLAGPVGVLEQVGAQHGVAVARSLRVARARLSRADQPLLLAATTAELHPLPGIDGAAVTQLPSVLVAPVATGR